MAVADVAEGFAEGVRAGSAGRDDAEVDGLRLELDGHDAGGDVGDERRNGEGGDAGWATLDEDAGLVLDGLHAADARADDHTEAFGIDLRDVDTRVLNGETRSGDCVLRVAVVTLGFLSVHELGRIKIADFCTDLGRKVRGVEARDTRNSGTTLDEGVPEGRVIVTEGRH